MIHINEYLLGKNKKLNTIYATNENIRQIVKDELDRLGHDANLNHIDVSKVTKMDNLFSCMPRYLGKDYFDINPDISEWDVKNVWTMAGMFTYCESFNCNISNWKVDNVEFMDRMFYCCKKFNQDISSWNTIKTKSTSEMFYYCESFDQNLSNWKLDNVIWGDDMFRGSNIKEEYKPHFKN